MIGPYVVPHWKGALAWVGDADGLGVAGGEALGDALGLGAGPPTFDVGRCSGLATNRTPTSSTAMTTAAAAAIQ
ncbi:MAG: hypothetical protein AUI15_03900 [Actinobacteria bacterium 13_2_20CM_2_66_6]|nr:MAG: hypothetical protein AUI15_03900 [Actinobacteria bacterium 13_2_20CM_2_66_6]